MLLLLFAISASCFLSFFPLLRLLLFVFAAFCYRLFLLVLFWASSLGAFCFPTSALNPPPALFLFRPGPLHTSQPQPQPQPQQQQQQQQQQQHRGAACFKPTSNPLEAPNAFSSKMLFVFLNGKSSAHIFTWFWALLRRDALRPLSARHPHTSFLLQVCMETQLSCSERTGGRRCALTPPPPPPPPILCGIVHLVLRLYNHVAPSSSHTLLYCTIFAHSCLE